VRRGSRVFTPALDNRAGCAILLELAARLRDRPVACAPWFVFSVQEEFSLRGVLPTARRIKPDVALAVDIAVACDTPDLDRTEVRLGGGPALSTYSFHGRGTLAGVIPNPRLLGYMESVAEQSGLPVQRNVFFGGLTDGSYVQLENEGIPTLDVGFPTRYTHSAMECCDLADLLATVDLLEAALRAMPADLDLRRGLPT
jgi:putative aminopeptidase